MSDEWLPDLIYLDDCGGDWEWYLDTLYRAFVADFVNSKPTWPGKRVVLKRYPEYQGKGATFWHMISEGDQEVERIPDLRRCERIRWPRPIIDAYPNHNPTPNDRLYWWKSKRRHEERYVLALLDFSYVVVVADRGDYVMPWTAYTVGQQHRRDKLRRECDDFWRTQS